MLVTFSCEEYENIVMFGEVAKRLLKMMGHSATVPGAIIAEEVPEALASLKQGLSQAQKENQSQNQLDEDEEEPVSIAHRALPLIHMLEAATKHQCNVMWK